MFVYYELFEPETLCGILFGIVICMLLALPFMIYSYNKDIKKKMEMEKEIEEINSNREYFVKENIELFHNIGTLSIVSDGKSLEIIRKGIV